MLKPNADARSMAKWGANIADIALYPYLALAPEARLDLQPFPAVRAWLTRIQQLDGYVGMPGMWQA